MKKIYTKAKQEIIVDANMYEWLNRFSWSIAGSSKDRTRYAILRLCLRRKVILNLKMHELVLQFNNIPIIKETRVDHINHNGLDNRLVNLRLATRSQNSMNSLIRTGRQYKGTSYRLDMKSNPWRAYITLSKKRIYLGHFPTSKKAAQAYNNAAIKYFGEFACLNQL